MATFIPERARAPSFHPPRGNLRLFFGGAGGRSAISAMLAAARGGHTPKAGVLLAQLHRNILDPLTDAGWPGPLVDMDEVPVRGVSACGGRLDAELIVQRRPTLLLVDTRSGSEGVAEREVRRIIGQCWRDIDVVLSAGIEVWAPLDASGLSSWAHCLAVRPLRVRRGSTRTVR